jgi:hypothetical protein
MFSMIADIAHRTIIAALSSLSPNREEFLLASTASI